MKWVAEFDGGYGKRGTIVAVPGDCLVCGASGEVLKMDASEGEYRSGAICLTCVQWVLGGSNETEGSFDQSIHPSSVVRTPFSD